MINQNNFPFQGIIFKTLKVIKKNSTLFSVDNSVAGKKELIFSKH